MLYIILFIVTVILTDNNVKIFQLNKKQKKYRSFYVGLLENPSNELYQEITNYIQNEKDELFINKSLVLKMYLGLINNQDIQADISNFKPFKVLSIKDKLNSKQYLRNTDLFLWLIFVITKANEQNKLQEIQIILDSFKEIDENLNYYLEYQIFKETALILLGGDLSNVKKIHDNYTPYICDKQLVQIYIRIIYLLFAFKQEKLTETQIKELNYFSTTKIGITLTTNLGLADKFKTEENNDN